MQVNSGSILTGIISKFSQTIAYLGLALLLLMMVSCTADEIRQLSNNTLKVTVSPAGQLLSVENLLASEMYVFESDGFELDTDQGIFSNINQKPVSVIQEQGGIVYQFNYGDVQVDLAYVLKGENGFFRRTLKVDNKVPLRVNNLVMGRTTFERQAEETLHYRTFIAAPTVNFIRFENGGMFCGIENSYFHSDIDNKGMTLAFEPALILKAGEGYESEPQFLGVYKNSGVRIADSGRPFRYDANGSGYKPLDRNETRAMRAYALDYIDPPQNCFLNINYQFFHPLPQMPNDPEAAKYFYKTIDTFSEIGGDMFIFKPLHRFSKPTEDKPYWNVVPDDSSHWAKKICDYATQKGIRFGFYMGVAGGHGKEGNAAGLNFRPDKPDWKKTDAKGDRGPDNCMAHDESYQWWLTIHNNTIKKYNLVNWSWDPSLGSGMNCHDESHGHFANRGGYKGWRRCIELMGRLKEENPGLFIQGFYGTKNFGLWGLKHVDQHEVLNEQTIIVSTKHKQISDDRQNADGLRFQNNWSMRFRFTPPVTGHALVHRISEGNFRPELIKAWDYYGWKYSVMSSLAIAGSFMPTILPYETELVPGYVDFYQKWGKWAKDNFELVNYIEPFGEQVQCGSIDGYSRIKGDQGFVFLFNGNPRPAEITFEVGDEINLQEEGTFQFTELYPSERGKFLLDENGKSTFTRGDKARMVVQDWTTLKVTGLSGKPGTSLDFSVQLGGAEKIEELTANGVGQKFTANDSTITSTIQFAGTRYQRELDQWVKSDSSSFSFPLHGAGKDLSLKSSFYLNPQVPELLAQAKPSNFNEMGKVVESWYRAGNEPRDLSYHNFIGCRPERLWLIIPTYRPTEVNIILNGRPVANQMVDLASDWIHADISDLVNHGENNQIELLFPEMSENNFMGPFLIYPEEGNTTEITPVPGEVLKPIVYTQPLDPTPPLRYKKGADPRVEEVKMLGNVRIKGEDRDAVVEVKIADYPKGISRVMYFQSGFPWMGQHALDYDTITKTWHAPVSPGPRWRIQENEFIYIWAEGNDGLRSEYFPVRVDWDF